MQDGTRAVVSWARRLALLVGFAAAIGTGCTAPDWVPSLAGTPTPSQPAEYPPAFQKAIADLCTTRRAPRAYCECLEEKIRATWSWDDLQKLVDTKGWSAVINHPAVRACASLNPVRR